MATTNEKANGCAPLAISKATSPRIFGQSGAQGKYTEALRLHTYGLKLCELHHNSKRPVGDGWNNHAVATVRQDAGGYGLMLAKNGMCSVDVDYEALCRAGLERCGFDLEKIRGLGVHTSSTRPGSGGRVTFKVPVASSLRWLKFSSKTHGTILELRAESPNLQDTLPGTVYHSQDGSGPWVQDYDDGCLWTLDCAPELPDDMLAWWQRMSTDVEYLREQQALMVGNDVHLAISSGGGSLAFTSPYRVAYNAEHRVPAILERHDYTMHRNGRYAPKTATGAAAVRGIPGRDDLWQSDHASDPLFGTFDAWTAHVVLDCGGDLLRAEAEAETSREIAAVDGFGEVNDEVLEQAKTATERRYKLLGSKALAALPPLTWRVRGVLPAQGLAAIYGASGSGKSFLAIDLCAAIARGRSWFGKHATAAPVVYLCLEGEAGIRLRVQAWEKHNGGPLPDGLTFILQSFDMSSRQDLADLLAVLPAGGVVVIDTLNRAAPCVDENSSKDMGQVLTTAKTIQAHTAGLVVLIHHTGKDQTKGLRGHSSLHAALDAAIEVQRAPCWRSWSVAKAKDGEDVGSYTFDLKPVEVGQDEYGFAETSCVIAPAVVDAVAEPKLTGAQVLALAAFDAVDLGLGAVARDDWRREFYDRLGDRTPEAKRQAFTRSVAALVDGGVLSQTGDFFARASLF